MSLLSEVNEMVFKKSREVGRHKKLIIYISHELYAGLKRETATRDMSEFAYKDSIQGYPVYRALDMFDHYCHDSSIGKHPKIRIVEEV